MSSGFQFLAFDTSTDVLSVAVSRGEHTWVHEGVGGAQASAHLIPVALDLMAQAGLQLSELTAIVFGRGPGSFTGLRTACAVAQGLAFGAHVPVLPVDTLLAVAEQARFDVQGEVQDQPLHVVALLDARMDEVYSAAYAWQGTALGWRMLQELRVSPPEAVDFKIADASRVVPCWCAGNAFTHDGERLHQLPASMPRVHAMPTAQALLRLAPALWRTGLAVPADQAMPLYVRDKVAYTTAERTAIKAAQMAQAVQAAALNPSH